MGVGHLLTELDGVGYFSVSVELDWTWTSSIWIFIGFTFIWMWTQSIPRSTGRELVDARSQ